MFANERQNEIHALINQNGAVTTSGLVETFGVSIETIRRDLLALEKQGKLSRVHGGAVKKTSMMPFRELKVRNEEQSLQKHNLSCMAAEFVSEGDIIAIDSGSTALQFAEVLKDKFSKLTVITHSLDVFGILSHHKEFSLILCGGYFIKSENTFCGPLTIDALNTLHVRKAFICPSAISLEYGIADYDSNMYDVQRQIMKSSDEIFILADSSKYEKKALLKLDDMKESYTYITDCELEKAVKNLYEENNIKIYTGKEK